MGRIAQQLEGIDERVERGILGATVSMTTVRPPCRSTRAASPMAPAMSGQWCALYRLTTPSKDSSGKGGALTSARTAV